MSRRGRSLMERFVEKFLVNNESGCWEWTACRNSDGYGRFNVNGRIEQAHRVAYKLYRGDIPGGKHALHVCDNPSCVNPEHLFLGTHEDNMRDMSEKGRHSQMSGESNGSAKLTEADVLEVRRLRRQGMYLYAIAVRTGVSRSQVHNICTGRSWGHVK